MRRLCLLLCLLLCAVTASAEENLLGGENETNVVSNIENTKGWKRHFVLGVGDGTLRDKSGTIADYASGAAIEASAERISEIVDGAHEGLTNALASLYAVTNNIGNFTDRIFIAGDLEASFSRDNWWCYIANEAYTGGDDILYIWFSRELDTPPSMKFKYSTDIGEEYVEGAWELPWATSVYDCGDFHDCHKITIHRPANVGRITMRVNAYPRFGTDVDGFDFAKRVFFLTDPTGTVTNLPWSGVWTNRVGVAHKWNNGIYMGVANE